jgi:hypothetical protein
MRVANFRYLFLFMVFFYSVSLAWSQDETVDQSSTENTEESGFGFDDETVADSNLGVVVGGDLSFAALQFLGDWATILERETQIKANGRLKISASGQAVEAVLKLLVNPEIITQDPARVLEEGRVRLFLGNGSYLEGGIMDLSWGKADSLGVLDVLNPLDQSDLSLSQAGEQKISQAMLHLNLALSESVSLEAVWLPTFTPNRTAWDGPWVARQVSELKTQGFNSLYYGKNPNINNFKGDGLYYSYWQSMWSTAYSAAYVSAFTDPLSLSFGDHPASVAAAIIAANTAVTANAAVIAAQAKAAAENGMANLLAYPNTQTLEYSQIGGRLNASAGGVDFGFQYFWGYLGIPAIVADPATINPTVGVPVVYNRYHQLGIDLATVLLSLNTRLELALNLTEDLEGSLTNVYNPQLVWALGFDRELFAGITLNLQAKGGIILNHQNISNVLDIEHGNTLSSTTIALRLNQKLARDTVEWELAGAWEIEMMDFLIAPAISFNIGDAILSIGGRIFGGQETGNLGQFWRNSYAEIRLSYSF